MEFDKNRVYTALNADELKVGSTVIVANDLRSLRARVEKFDTSYEVHLSDILSEAAIHRFETSSGYVYVLAYLIEPPKEPQYEPFSTDNSDNQSIFKIITEHGGWLKDKTTGELSYISGIDIDHKSSQLHISNGWYSAEDIFETYTFADDGTPVGEKIEDAAQSGIGG